MTSSPMTLTINISGIARTTFANHLCTPTITHLLHLPLIRQPFSPQVRLWYLR